VVPARGRVGGTDTTVAGAGNLAERGEWTWAEAEAEAGKEGTETGQSRGRGRGRTPEIGAEAAGTGTEPVGTGMEGAHEEVQLSPISAVTRTAEVEVGAEVVTSKGAELPHLGGGLLLLLLLHHLLSKQRTMMSRMVWMEISAVVFLGPDPLHLHLHLHLPLPRPPPRAPVVEVATVATGVGVGVGVEAMEESALRKTKLVVCLFPCF
jgi:hypothetical protein